MTIPNFEAALATFLQRAQAIVTTRYQREFPGSTVPQLSLEPGRRYVRVVRAKNDHDRGAYCFVDRQSGAILKAESWKKPHPRPLGTIFADTTEGVDPDRDRRTTRPSLTLTTPDRVVSVTER